MPGEIDFRISELETRLRMSEARGEQPSREVLEEISRLVKQRALHSFFDPGGLALYMGIPAVVGAAIGVSSGKSVLPNVLLGSVVGLVARGVHHSISYGLASAAEYVTSSSVPENQQGVRDTEIGFRTGQKLSTDECHNLVNTARLLSRRENRTVTVGCGGNYGYLVNYRLAVSPLPRE